MSIQRSLDRRMGASIRGKDNRSTTMEYLILIYGDERAYGTIT